MMHSSVTCDDLRVIVKGVVPWETGHVGYAGGMMKFFDEEMWECWKTQVGDAVEDVEMGQGMCVVGRGQSAFILYWKGNVWSCLTGFSTI